MISLPDQPHAAGGGGVGGVGKCPRWFQPSRTSFIFKQYLRDFATFTKMYWRTRFFKSFMSRVYLVAMAIRFSTPRLVKC